MEVARAVFLAAGRGSRMAPVTDKLPKPLVPVNGKRIITTLLDAVVAAGIREIYIVCGYRREQFAMLQHEYPMVTLLDNPYYKQANNISSIYVAGNRVQNAYIIESDLLLRRGALISPDQMRSNYLAIPVEKTDDWCFFTDLDNKIKKIMVGGKNCQQMVGISYWTAADGKRLAECTKKLFADRQNWQLYWDQVALEYFLGEFSVYTRPCGHEDVVEIDTLAELQALDSSYR